MWRVKGRPPGEGGRQGTYPAARWETATWGLNSGKRWRVLTGRRWPDQFSLLEGHCSCRTASAGGAGLWEVVAAWTRAGLRVERSTCVWEVNLIGLGDRLDVQGQSPVSRLPSGVWLAWVFGWWCRSRDKEPGKGWGVGGEVEGLVCTCC